MLLEARVDNDHLRQTLQEKLESDGNSFFQGGFLNNIVDLSLSSVTVLASLVATVLATADLMGVPRWVLAAIAAIPAAASSLQRIVAIRDRSNWYFMYVAQVRALAMQLQFNTAAKVERIAQERAEPEIAMETQWTRIGHLRSSPVSTRSANEHDKADVGVSTQY